MAPGRRRRTNIVLPPPKEGNTKPTKREKVDAYLARKQAMHFILQFEFKRTHRLTNVSRFVYATYLSKSLRIHIIDILEPSRTTCRAASNAAVALP